MDRIGQFLYNSRMQRSAPPLVPTYNLFGELGDLPDVIHCETIEARSRLHDWELAAHRHARLHQVLLLEDGGGTLHLEGTPRPLVSGTLVNVPMGVVHGFSFQPGTRGLVVTFAAEMLDQTLRPAEGLRDVLAQPALIPVNPETAATMAQIAQGFSSRTFGRAQILRSLAGLLLGQIAQTISETDPGGNRPVAPDLVARFELLIDQHLLDHWSVSDYASALAVSAAHLSRVTRNATGRPASGLIEDRLVREARRNLVFTNLPVSRIAYALGFEDPAYFTRVFTRATGVSPRAFRQRLDGSM